MWELVRTARDSFLGNLYPLLLPVQGPKDKLPASVVKVDEWQEEGGCHFSFCKKKSLWKQKAKLLGLLKTKQTHHVIKHGWEKPIKMICLCHG